MQGEGRKRKIVVSAVDTNNGNYITFNEDGVKEMFASKIRASCSMPFIFPHVDILDMVLLDGGVSWTSNMVTALDRCKEIVDEDN